MSAICKPLKIMSSHFPSVPFIKQHRIPLAKWNHSPSLALRIRCAPRRPIPSVEKKRRRSIWKNQLWNEMQMGSPKKALQCRNEKRLHMPVYMQISHIVHMCVNIWQLLGTGAVSLFLLFFIFFTAWRPLFVLFADIQISVQKDIHTYIAEWRRPFVSFCF